MNSVEIDIFRFFDPQEIEVLAKESGFVERRSPVNGLRFLLTFTTGLLNTPDGTLAQLAAFLGATCGAAVSAQAVDERIDETAKRFLKGCLRRALELAAALPLRGGAALASFDHVFVIDSTTFELRPALAPHFKGSGGGASPAALRIQFAFDYRSGFMHVEIGDVRLADAPTLAKLLTAQTLPLDGVCLFLSDLGYFKITTFAEIRHEPHHHFLSKLQFGVKLTTADDAELDLQSLLKKAPDQFELPVKLGATPCRLVGQRLPDAVVNARIRKANQASEGQRRQISDLYRLFLHYALFVTSLPREYGMPQLFALYRIRWQVELVFKVWKSILAIHRIRSAKEPRVLCEVYGKLIVAALAVCLCSAAAAFLDTVPLSLHKVARHLRGIATNWALTILAGGLQHAAFLKNLARTLARFCKKSRHKRKPTIDDILRHAFAKPFPFATSSAFNP
jgi:hypothetical protein